MLLLLGLALKRLLMCSSHFFSFLETLCGHAYNGLAVQTRASGKTGGENLTEGEDFCLAGWSSTVFLFTLLN